MCVCDNFCCFITGQQIPWFILAYTVMWHKPCSPESNRCKSAMRVIVQAILNMCADLSLKNNWKSGKIISQWKVREFSQSWLLETLVLSIDYLLHEFNPLVSRYCYSHSEMGYFWLLTTKQSTWTTLSSQTSHSKLMTMK